MVPRFFVPAISLMVVSGFVLAQPPSPATNESEQPTGKSHAHTNRLAKESSPYLLQHAHNPVDWYPWGDEALQKAKREDKMIFLSVGYSACHWCHVMERESFQDPEIARILNDKFVCVKVDREERPDVDQLYMTAVQLVGRQAGWPMSIFLLPDARPFWGGSYFPARDGDRAKATGFLSIMNEIDTAWKTKRSDVEQQAEALTEAVKATQLPAVDLATAELEEALVEGVVRSLLEQYDPEYGGFGSGSKGPKFPEPSNLIFLLDRASRRTVNGAQRDSAKRMLLKTLDGMISGAMYDHLGGGFHRYSVDQRWQIPHFEKMLYDNAQLASVYAAAYRETQRDEYRHILEGICDFVIRELKAPGGAFFSALDADSEGEEGKFYRWTKEELQSLKSVKSFRGASIVYRLGGKPNFEVEFFVPDPGTSLTQVAKRLGADFSSLNERLAPARKAMLEVRSRRTRPMTDTKILTAWNGLMIAGLADAGQTLDRKDYTEAALKAAMFLVRNLRDEDGRLSRSFAGGKAKLNAYLDDYAFLVSGLIALHRSTGDPRLLALAKELCDKQIELFWDEVAGGLYFTSKDHPSLILRVKDPVDSAIPSGTSVSAENLLYLARQLEDTSYEQRLEQTLQSLVPLLRGAPSAAPRAAAVLAEYLDASSDP